MSFSEFLGRFDSTELIVLFGVALPATIIAVTAIVGGIWWKYRKLQLEMHFKQSLVDKGLSADDIERVIKTPVGPPED